jgi:hypothetical protein
MYMRIGQQITGTEWHWIEGDIFHARRTVMIGEQLFDLVLNKHHLGSGAYDETWYLTVENQMGIEMFAPIRVGIIPAKAAALKSEKIIRELLTPSSPIVEG